MPPLPDGIHKERVTLHGLFPISTAGGGGGDLFARWSISANGFSGHVEGSAFINATPN
jgi:hypothetical protein